MLGYWCTKLKDSGLPKGRNRKWLCRAEQCGVGGDPFHLHSHRIAGRKPWCNAANRFWSRRRRKTVRSDAPTSGNKDNNKTECSCQLITQKKTMSLYTSTSVHVSDLIWSFKSNANYVTTSHSTWKPWNPLVNNSPTDGWKLTLDVAAHLKAGTGKDCAGQSSVTLCASRMSTLRLLSPDVRRGATLASGSEVGVQKHRSWN